MWCIYRQHIDASQIPSVYLRDEENNGPRDEARFVDAALAALLRRRRAAVVVLVDDAVVNLVEGRILEADVFH